MHGICFRAAARQECLRETSNDEHDEQQVLDLDLHVLQLLMAYATWKAQKAHRLPPSTSFIDNMQPVWPVRSYGECLSSFLPIVHNHIPCSVIACGNRLVLFLPLDRW